MTKHEFYTKWLEHFTKDIPAKEIKKHVTSEGNLIWHTFSWELLDKSRFLEGDDAKAAYNKQYKGGALYIEWFRDEETHNLTFDLERADALDKMDEVYVAAEDFSWTYIKTHEERCGPYFMKL